MDSSIITYMKLSMAAALLLCACAVFARTRSEKRFTGLEKRVTKVEKRVTRLEAAPLRSTGPAAAQPKRSPTPVGAAFIGKKQVVGHKKIGMTLYLEFENLSGRDLFAFNGTLVFRNESGGLIWSRPYAHSEPLGAGQKVDVSMGILSEQAKAYLQFVKARSVTVSLEKQEAYGAE